MVEMTVDVGLIDRWDSNKMQERGALDRGAADSTSQQIKIDEVCFLRFYFCQNVRTSADVIVTHIHTMSEIRYLFLCTGARGSFTMGFG